MKYVIVTGGVTSSLGKGVVTASIGRLLKARGFSVVLQKFDPYLNVDPGTLSPYQHGEVFVTDDGAETDLDLGHYERFVGIKLNKDSNVTTGKIYQTILKKERRGDYLGSTVQVIPHVTDEIKKRLCRKDKQTDVVITEIGGTVGDIESLPFLEAVRQLRNDVGQSNIIYVHVTLVPTVISEVKTKPTQHSVKELRSIGIQPDILICRTEKRGCLTDSLKKKISDFCNVDCNAVFENNNVNSIYELPELLHEQGLDDIIVKKLQLPCSTIKLDFWQGIKQRFLNLNHNMIMVGIVGKYVELPDAYLSVVEAVKHAGFAAGENIEIDLISTQDLKDYPVERVLDHLDGIIIPGGFGERGVEEKISAISWARKTNIPCFGICLGMQAMCIEAARSQGLNANSTEFDQDTPNPVITLLEEQRDIQDKGGTMRLGSYHCYLLTGTKVKQIYNKDDIKERHRHRYKVNPKFYDILTQDGLIVSGMSPDGNLVEVVERQKQEHPWFIGCQFHPEFKSHPNRPHPLFLSFIKAVIQGANCDD